MYERLATPKKIGLDVLKVGACWALVLYNGGPHAWWSMALMVAGTVGMVACNAQLWRHEAPMRRKTAFTPGQPVTFRIVSFGPQRPGTFIGPDRSGEYLWVRLGDHVFHADEEHVMPGFVAAP